MDQSINVEQTPKINFLAMALVALLILIVAGFLSSGTGPHTTPVGDTIAEGEKSSLATSPSDFPNIKIKNFGQMDAHFYRGAQPKPSDYKFLAALGVKTIIDLRDDPTSYEKPKAEAAGIRYINIPMDDKSEPSLDMITTFLDVAKDSKNWPFFVHCAGGRHRTGLIGAVYRFNMYGWDLDKAYEEMKNYDFYTSWGHEPIKDFVMAYAKKIKAEKPFLPAEDPNKVLPTSEPITAPPPPKPEE